MTLLWQISVTNHYRSWQIRYDSVFGSVAIVAATLRFRFFTVLQLHPKPVSSRQTLRLSAGLPVDLLVYFYKFRLFAIVLAA
jgi:hypothetical protein